LRIEFGLSGKTSPSVWPRVAHQPLTTSKIHDERKKIMSRFKMLFAALVVAAITGIVPQAHATLTVEVSIAGSSAQWQSLALAAYYTAAAGTSTAHAHWTSASNVVNLTDNRGGINNVDAGTLWVVWNCGTSTCAPTEVWIFDKVDSVVGDRCYFANPACTISATSTNLSGSGANKINAALFGGTSDIALPPTVVTLLENGVTEGTAATDIRPEDAMYAMCRVNSKAGAGSGLNSADGLDGLGYNSNINAGVCPTYGSLSSASEYVGTPIKSGLPGEPSTDAANVISFNISGNDPITNNAIPAYSVLEVGAAPIVFLRGNQNNLAGLTDATSTQLQQVFSGTNCDATAFGAAFSGGINIFLREPTSGTMNTTEATVFRGPVVSLSGGANLGLSQETGGLSGFNPLGDAHIGPCTSASGNGRRYRVIGTGEAVDGVYNSSLTSGWKAGQTGAFNNTQDGLGYAFFSYGNVSDIADSTKYSYIQLNGVDPIFSTYANQIATGKGYDPGQPATAGMVPGFSDLTSFCNATTGYPCPEYKIWAGGYSFPNVRSGSYSSWSLLRLITATTGGQKTALTTLLTKADNLNVAAVPDFIPYAATVCTTTSTPFACPVEIEDPGLLLTRSHYQQYDGARTAIGPTPHNDGTAEAGGDMGGEVFICPTSTTCPNNATAGVVGTTHHYSPQSLNVLAGFGNQTSASGGTAGSFQIRQ
jgi:hypothetical protein